LDDAPKRSAPDTRCGAMTRYAHMIGIGDGSAAGPIWRTYFQIDDLLGHPFGW
jgi:hypothetical protein